MMIADTTGPNHPWYDFSAPASPGVAPPPDPLYHELIGTRAFQRMKCIRFLGGIDYILVRTPNGVKGNIRYTRYQHSIGVASLALFYCGLRSLTLSDRRVVYSAALLHDIGHAPLSHSLEPVFEEVFGLEHHRATEEIITGRAPLGREIRETLHRYRVDIERIIAIISGDDRVYDAFFSSPINFDTIEGVLRTLSYAKPYTNLPQPTAVVKAALERSNTRDRDIVDEFWTCKDQVYRYLINSKLGVLADYACQLFMRRRLKSIEPSDYYATEKTIFRKLSGLKPLLTSTSFEAEILQQLDRPIMYNARRFYVERKADFFARDDKGRYKQTKQARTLLPSCVDPENCREKTAWSLFHDERNRTST